MSRVTQVSGPFAFRVLFLFFFFFFSFFFFLFYLSLVHLGLRSLLSPLGMALKTMDPEYQDQVIMSAVSVIAMCVYKHERSEECSLP